MFIREVKKKNATNGKTFCQYQLVQAARIEGKVKQSIILYLGSDSLLSNLDSRKKILDLLQAKIFGQPVLFAGDYANDITTLVENFYQKFLLKYKDVPISSAVCIPTVERLAHRENIDVNSIEIEQVKSFGGEHLCSQVLDKLDLKSCLEKLNFSKQDIELSHVSIIARALFCSSEYKTVQYLRDNSSLCHLQGIAVDDFSHRDLYAVCDNLYNHREIIDKFIYKRIVDLFDLKDSLVIYDLSNTYFEGRKDKSKRARYGRSKEKRNDCKQIIFAGVINREGFIRYSRIYDGNTSEMTTLKDMINDLKNHSNGYKDKTVVLDAGFASEENLELLSAEGLKYICVSRKRIKDYKVMKHETMQVVQDKNGSSIELSIFKPKEYKDTWMYVKSEQKRVKEQSMEDKLSRRFEEELQGLSRGIGKKGSTKKVEKIWERIGRIKERHSMVSGRYHIDVQTKGEIVTEVTWKRKEETDMATGKDHGVYFIRTNYENPQESKLWEIYNTIREVEATFRCLKSDLNIRPIHHQKDERIESHIYLTILSYQLVNTIRYMLKENGIHDDWKNIRRIMSTQTLQTIVLPAEKKNISIEKPSRPIKEALAIYKATNTNSIIPAKKKNVVYH